jgi:hypothetical protein
LGGPADPSLENLEAHSMVNASQTILSQDAVALRRELALRILLQNLLLTLSLSVFTAFAGIALVVPESVWAAAAAQGVVGLGATLQWCHHGIRTKQIKTYILIAESHDAGIGWENWLPANRPRTLLGSRWLISTKGVFIGLQTALIILATRIAPEPEIFWIIAAAVLLLLTAGFLLTNPKE